MLRLCSFLDFGTIEEVKPANIRAIPKDDVALAPLRDNRSLSEARAPCLPETTP